MILDTSAIVATIAREPDAARFQNARLGAHALAMSAVTAQESRIVLHARYGAAAVEAFEEMIEGAQIEIVPFDMRMANSAFAAFRRCGKGQGDPAQLNSVDCVAYATAQLRGEPLPFKGSDFDKTDIPRAV